MKRRPRILLADDHAMVLEAFRRLLEPRCEIVGVARNGRTLLELAATTEPEIIILDVAMPKLNGLEACARLRRKMPEVKCIFLTVNEDPDFAAAAIRIGASGYVLKSSTPSELFTAIECALAGKTLHHAADQKRSVSQGLSRPAGKSSGEKALRAPMRSFAVSFRRPRHEGNRRPASHHRAHRGFSQVHDHGTTPLEE